MAPNFSRVVWTVYLQLFGFVLTIKILKLTLLVTRWFFQRKTWIGPLTSEWKKSSVLDVALCLITWSLKESVVIVI